MKYLCVFFLGLFFVNCSKLNEKLVFSPEALKEKMVDFENNSFNFEQVLKKHQGKITLIDIWASWCPDCIAGMPKLKELQAKFPELQMVYLSYDKTPETWAAAIEKYDLKGDHYLLQSAWKGGDFRKHIDLDWIPRYILIDKTGKIVKYRAIEADDESLINILNTL